MAPPRHVLLIICDDLNTTAGRYVAGPLHTPSLDRLAAQGVRFDRACCQSPLSTPSRASMLAGRRPDWTGVHTLKPSAGSQFAQQPDTVTLPRLFRDRGHFTARSGKVFHKGVPDSIITRSVGPDDPHAWTQRREPPCYELNTNGELHAPVPYRLYPAGAGGAVTWLRADDRKDMQHHDVGVREDIIDWLHRDATEPSFLAAGFVRPHVPLVAPERHFRHYDDCPIALPDRSETSRRDRPDHYARWFGADVPLSEADHADAIRAYLACVSFIDEQVGRLLDALEATGRLDDTLIIFTADHGYHLGEHGLWFKRSLYQESVRVPLIIADPTRPSGHGSVHDDPVELLDIFPTVAEACGIDHDLPLDGRSLVPLLDAPDTRTDHAAFVQTGDEPGSGGIEGRSSHTRRWAYHAWRGCETSHELYDLEADPLQMHNLADGADHTAIRKELAAMLASALPWPR